MFRLHFVFSINAISVILAIVAYKVSILASERQRQRQRPRPLMLAVNHGASTLLIYACYGRYSYDMCDIYFCGSIRAGRQDAEIYRRLIQKLKEHGTVLTEFVGAENCLEEEGHHDGHHEKLNDAEIHERDMKLLDQCDVLVAEVTQPSLGVGYEIGRAVVANKPILCLYRPAGEKMLSSLIRGIHNGKSIMTVDYKFDDVDSVLSDFFQKNGKPPKT